jgi:hypothetical protein
MLEESVLSTCLYAIFFAACARCEVRGEEVSCLVRDFTSTKKVQYTLSLRSLLNEYENEKKVRHGF